MLHPRDHITVCIPTFKRPVQLGKLLSELQQQVTNGLFTYSVLVVDNDFAESARAIVEDVKAKSLVRIEYYSEPEQNIALARNKAVENAHGDFIAFIDDDELPISTWLLELHSAFKKYGVDGVLGPVRPYFDQEAPAWIVKGKFCERKEHATGTILHFEETRTGNVLLDIRLFNERENWFGSEFGRTGGEDIEFFKKAMKQGRIFLWCNEAIVYETITPDRWSKCFYIKKNLRIGDLTGEKFRKEGFLLHTSFFIRNIIAMILYTSFMPFTLAFGQHVQMKCITKIVYCFGVIIGSLGWVPIRYR